MGDIVSTDDDSVTFEVEVSAAVPIERIELRNRMQVIETWRPYEAEQLGRRIRIIWEGSEYRGRGRQSVWDGSATLTDNEFTSVVPINLWNIDKPLQQPSPDQLVWSALTTGGFGGADALLADAYKGRLKIDTKLVKADLALSEIGLDDIVLETGDGIGRQMRVFRR